MITKQMESDQAWTKNRLDDLGRLVMIVVMYLFDCGDDKNLNNNHAA